MHKGVITEIESMKKLAKKKVTLMTLILIIWTTMNEMIQMRFLLYPEKRPFKSPRRADDDYHDDDDDGDGDDDDDDDDDDVRYFKNDGVGDGDDDNE
jgi:hypothetical protein